MSGLGLALKPGLGLSFVGLWLHILEAKAKALEEGFGLSQGFGYISSRPVKRGALRNSDWKRRVSQSSVACPSCLLFPSALPPARRKVLLPSKDFRTAQGNSVPDMVDLTQEDLGLTRKNVGESPQGRDVARSDLCRDIKTTQRSYKTSKTNIQIVIAGRDQCVLSGLGNSIGVLTPFRIRTGSPPTCSPASIRGIHGILLNPSSTHYSQKMLSAFTFTTTDSLISRNNVRFVQIQSFQQEAGRWTSLYKASYEWGMGRALQWRAPSHSSWSASSTPRDVRFDRKAVLLEASGHSNGRACPTPWEYFSGTPK
ncbi:hypothetical protein B0H13DRAFT_2261910 [Mycena leptocephala]|nr:hypothetical protein B0H13DRAFT_2261910 [Mycena leptocephala]